MADLSIRSDFVDGVMEIFTTLFNDGESDGFDLYLLSDKSQQNVYGESKVKVYRAPIKLVTQAHINPTHGQQDVETVKGIAKFTVPLKSFQSKEVDVSTAGLAEIRKGVIEFHGTYYTIDNITPKAYIEDVFLLYDIDCTEDLDLADGLVIEEPEEETPDGGDDSEFGSSDDGGLE